MTDPATPPADPRVPYAVHPEAPEYPEDHIICPYCLYEDHEPGEHSALRHDGDSTEFECPECDQVSVVSLQVTCEYLTEPIDPEVPRKPFSVMVALEGTAVATKIDPSSTGSSLIVATLVRLQRDPFNIQSKDFIGGFMLEDAAGGALKNFQLLVSQGVRPNHQLFIKRKPVTP